MLSAHRIEKCTLQIALPSENNLEVVKLLAQEKPRILEAILAVFDREVPENLQISLSKIHLDLGTVSRQNFIQTLTNRLIALLSAELKRLANEVSVRPSLTHRIEPTGIASPFDEADSPARTNLLPDESRPGVEMRLFPYRAAIVSDRWGALPPETLLAVVAQYFRTGAFPRAFKALQTTDIAILVNYLVDSKARPFTDYLSRRIGVADFQLKLVESLPYDTLLAIARLLPALNTSLPAWLAWIEKVDAEGVSTWKYTSPAKRLLLQYLTAASLHDKEKIKEEYRQTAVRPYRDDSVLTYTIRSPRTLFGSIPTSERDRLHTKERLAYLHTLFQAHSHSPVVRHSLIEKLTLPELHALVHSLGVAHGSYTHWLVFARKVKDLYKAEHAVLSDSVKRAIYRRYIDLISTQHKSSVTFERLDQFLLLELQLLPEWPQAVSQPTTSELEAATTAGETIAISLGSSASGQAKQPDVHAFAVVRFYYRYGYFPIEAQHLRATDLDALILYLLAWNPARLAQYVLTLAVDVTFTARLADTLSANTLKTILSASGRVSDALAEWNLWERILESLIAKNTFLSFADRFVLLRYIRAPKENTRGEIIYEYLLSLYALQGSRFTTDTIRDVLGQSDNIDGATVAARDRIVRFLPAFVARENDLREGHDDRLMAFHQYLAHADAYAAQDTLNPHDHPSYADWVAFQTRIGEAVAEINVSTRDAFLQELAFYYIEFLRRHGHEVWSGERFQQYMLHKAEQMLAATVPEVDVMLLRLRIDASAASVTLHWRPALEEMMRQGILHVVSTMPALQDPAAIEALWDTALAEEPAVFLLFYEAEVTASFWPALTEMLSFTQLHRLLSILAPAQYRHLSKAGGISENVATTRDTFSLAFKILHDSRYTIGTQKLLDAIFHDGLASPVGPTTLPGALAPEYASLTEEDVAFPLITLVNRITQRTGPTQQHWKFLYHQHRITVVRYVQAHWSWKHLRESLAQDADLTVLTGLTASLWHGDATYNALQNFLTQHMPRESLLRTIYRHYFDFLSQAAYDRVSSLFTRWLEELSMSLDIAAGHTSSRTNPEMGDETPRISHGPGVETTDKVPRTLSDGNSEETFEHGLILHDAADGIQRKPKEEANALLAALYAGTLEAHTSTALRWQDLYTGHRQALVYYIQTHRYPQPIHDSLALEAHLDILLDLSALLFRDDETYAAWSAFTERYRGDTMLLRKSYQYYFGFLRNIRQGLQSTLSFAVWLDTVAYALNDISTRAQAAIPGGSQDSTVNRGVTPLVSLPLLTPLALSDLTVINTPSMNFTNAFGKEQNASEQLPASTPQADSSQPQDPASQQAAKDTSLFDSESIIIYYLRAGWILPNPVVADIAALSKRTSDYFLAVTPADNILISVALDVNYPEAHARLTPLLSPEALAMLQQQESLVNAPLAHYTARRIYTLRQIESTLHYWVYGHRPWWYTSPYSPEATAHVVLEHFLELLVERLKTVGHELVTLQNIFPSLPHEVFPKIITIRFPTVAGFVARVFSLLEKTPDARDKAAARHGSAVFYVVYEYLVHHADAFSALHFLSYLAGHSAVAMRISESAWIDRMLSTAESMQQEDPQLWSLHELLASLRTTSAATGELHSSEPNTPTVPLPFLLPHVAADGAAGISPTFKEAFVAYLRVGIIPIHTLESQGDGVALIRQLHYVASHEFAWLTTTMKSLFMNAAALDEFLLRGDLNLTYFITKALSDTRQREFSRWRHAMMGFLLSLPPTPRKRAPLALGPAELSYRSLLQLLLQRPVFKITAIQYVQSVFHYILEHKTIQSMDALLDKIHEYKAEGSSEDFAISLEAAHAQMVARARTLQLQSLTAPNVKIGRTIRVPEKGSRILVEGSGVVLIAPFFYTYFNRLEMTENNSFKSNIHAVRAVHLLHYLVRGHTETPRQPLLYNLLCGVDLFLPLEDTIELTDHEIQVSESLLQGVLQNWTSLQSKSVDALRETFLQRAGHLEENEIGWNLTVDRKSMDILVDWIPWSFSLIKLSWMEKSLTVNWQSDQYRDLMLTKP